MNADEPLIIETLSFDAGCFANRSSITTNAKGIIGCGKGEMFEYNSHKKKFEEWPFKKELNDGILSIKFSDETQMVYVGGKKLFIIDYETKNIVKIIQNHEDYISCISLKNNLIATSSWDKTLSLTNHDSYESILLIGHTHKVTVCTFAINKDLLYSSSFDKTLKVWNINNHQCIKSIDCGGTLGCIEQNNDGSLLLTGDVHGNITLRETEEFAVISKIKTTANSPVFSICILSPNTDKILCGTRSGNVECFNIYTKESLFNIKPHTACVNTILYFETYNEVMTCSGDKKCKILQVNNEMILHQKSITGEEEIPDISND